uniref:Uncharacterized protein n=1 Tax=Romanomermis culicivorax TaxID=13658 RepID=A0A915HP21_ROMCU
MEQTIGETISEKPVNLESIEKALQKQYQMAVIKSQNMEIFPPPKDYQPAQKDTSGPLLKF